jgi:23S rRNA (uracil1939-C5)-methyltransferase
MGDLVDLLVDSLGARGDGIAAHAGEPVFLPYTVPGDRVRARLGVRRGGGREGRVVERLGSGAGRADPPCSHFGRCGGCALQHLDPASYRAAKLGALRAALERVGIDPYLVQPLRVVPPARRRARLGLIRPRNPRWPAPVGFRERFSHDLVDLVECPVLERALFALVGELRLVAAVLLPPGGAAEAMLTRTDSGIDMLIETAAPPALAALEALVQLAERCDLARIVWQIPGEEILVVERRPVRVLVSGVAVPFPPGAFLQASAAAETILASEVGAGVGPNRPVLDLFAGLGTFTFALAAAGPVHAVEGDERAAAALAQAAAGQPGVTVERRDLARNPLPPEALAGYAAAVFDPPRAGAARQAEALASSAIAKVVAVSCKPATFARDAAWLIGGGFRLERVVAFDQFVWTPHLELAALFSR